MQDSTGTSGGHTTEYAISRAHKTFLLETAVGARLVNSTTDGVSTDIRLEQPVGTQLNVQLAVYPQDFDWMKAWAHG